MAYKPLDLSGRSAVVIGGTSGITVDNNSGQAQASSIYFGTLQKSAASPCGANLYCAVKLTQGGLQ